MHIIVYIKPDYMSVYKILSTYPYDRKVGETNSYGWEIITIQSLYNKRFYTHNTILKMIEEERKRNEKRNSRIDKIILILDIIFDGK